MAEKKYITSREELEAAIAAKDAEIAALQTQIDEQNSKIATLYEGVLIKTMSVDLTTDSSGQAVLPLNFPQQRLVSISCSGAISLSFLNAGKYYVKTLDGNMNPSEAQRTYYIAYAESI